MLPAQIYATIASSFVFLLGMGTAEHSHTLLDKVATLPDQPGVYLFKDATGTILYIGKAKNLRQRLRQYFDRSRAHDAKTVAMLRRASALDCIVTDTEVEALLLENNLIKEHKPRYNILLKDDKTYPYICVTAEEFPRIFPTRRIVRDGSLYFGPYADVQSMHFLLKLLRTLFPIRSCALPLTEDTIAQGKYKVCLDYHIGKCEGPCAGLLSKDRYRRYIEQAIEILRGKTKTVEQQLEAEMAQLADDLQFERAAIVRDRLGRLRSYAAKQKVVSAEFVDRDIVGYTEQDDYSCVVVLVTREGKVIGKRHWIVPSSETTGAQIVRSVIEQWYLDSEDVPAEILLPFDLGDEADFLIQWFAVKRQARVKLSVPKIGDKRKLVTLACSNAEYQLRDYLLSRARREQAVPRTLTALQRDLRLPKPPLRIECFDNSHLQGSDYVSSMVVFIEGKPRKSEYRRYRLRDVAGNDDFRAMAEVIRRRYERVLRENLPLPDLIIVDGGKGQLSAASDVLDHLGISDRVPIVALAKRLEEIFVPGERDAILLPRTSSSLRLMQQIRDEAHRFAVEYHRLLRSKRTLRTELLSLPGIGQTTATKLLKHFGSIAAIENASIEQLTAVVGARIARTLYDTLHARRSNTDGPSIEEM